MVLRLLPAGMMQSSQALAGVQNNGKQRIYVQAPSLGRCYIHLGQYLSMLSLAWGCPRSDIVPRSRLFERYLTPDGGNGQAEKN